MHSIITILSMISAVLVLLSLFMPFYGSGSLKYCILGIQDSGIIGCLGTCRDPLNNNCMADDATMVCQSIQALYIVSFVLLVGAMLNSSLGLKYVNPLFKQFKHNISALFLGLSFVTLMIGFLLAIFHTDDNYKVYDIVGKDGLVYRESFGFSIGALIITFVGFVLCLPDTLY